jgi:hypothetical protein
MRFNLYDSGEGRTRPRHITSIAAGVVKDNLDLPMYGRVLVRIPAIDMEVWAVLSSFLKKMTKSSSPSIRRIPTMRI